MTATQCSISALSDGELLRLCTDYARVMMLYPEDIACLEKLSSDSPMAAFVLGRYYHLMGDPKMFPKVRELYDFSERGGCPEATFGKSLVFRRGDEGCVDRLKYVKMRDEAARKGSLLARMQRCKDKYSYYDGYGDVAEAIAEIRHEIASSPDADPAWHCLLGWALEGAGLREDAYEAFKTGTCKGCLMAWEGRLYLHPRDREELSEAQRAGCGVAYVVEAQELLGKYGDAPSMEREDLHARIEKLLLSAMSLGSEVGYCMLGRALYFGMGGFEQSRSKAWNLLMKSGQMGCGVAYDFLAEMIDDGGEVPQGYGKEQKAIFELLALRLGDEECLEDVVTAYRCGFLQEYADEIEEYYIPEYEDEEREEDDGRWDAYV